MSDNNEQTGNVSELDLLKQRARMMGITFSNNISLETLRQRVNAKIDADSAEEAELDADEDAEAEEAETNGLEAAAEVADTRDTRPDPNYNSQVDADGDGHDDRTGQFVDGNQAAAKPEAKPEKKLTPAQRKAKEKAERRQKLVREQLKLVRVRIQNLDPKKATLPGEIFTVGNRTLGTIRKFIPYGEVTEDGYHIPYIIYRQLEARKFLNIRTVKDRRTGHIRTETSWAKEFALEVLPPLTQEELDKLANAQKAAGSVDPGNAA